MEKENLQSCDQGMSLNVKCCSIMLFRERSQHLSFVHYAVQRAVQPSHELIGQLSQEGLEGGEAQITEKRTRSGHSGFL